MAKDPAFLFYANDWIGGTMGMTFEEKGAYMELLMLQFNRGHMTKHMIGQTVGQLFGQIEDKFVIDENGLYYNIRLDEEKNKRINYTNSRTNNRLGTNQHTKKGTENGVKKAGHMTKHMIGHMENENKDVNNVLNLGEKELVLETLKSGTNFETQNPEAHSTKFFDMVVSEMNQIWLKHNAGYSAMKAVDFPALLQIAYLIGERKGISQSNVVGQKESEITAAFDKISSFLKTTDDKFFKKLTLDGIAIPKNFQKIEEAMRQKLNPEKSPEKSVKIKL